MSCRLLSCCSKYSKGTCGKNSVSTFVLSWEKENYMAKISKKHSCRVNVIQTNCVVTPFFEKKDGMLVSGCEVESSVWDTGATNTIISTAVVEALGRMDIITLGDFVISNKDNQTWFAFRYPSSDHIEF